MAKKVYTKTPRAVLDSNEKWAKEHTKFYGFRLDIEKDHKLIGWFESRYNKTQTVRDALYLLQKKEKRQKKKEEKKINEEK